MNSDDRVQILRTALLVSHDARRRFDLVSVRAAGKWYTRDLGLFGVLPPTVEVTQDGLLDYEDWQITVASRIPTSQEVSVARAIKRLSPPRNVSLPFPDETRPTIGELQQQVADELHVPVSLVQETYTADLRQYPLVFVCVRSMPLGCQPDDASIEPSAIRRPANFPNAALVVDEACKGQPQKMRGGVPMICEIEIP